MSQLRVFLSRMLLILQYRAFGGRILLRILAEILSENLASEASALNPPTHSRVFVRFGNTKDEIRFKKGD